MGGDHRLSQQRKQLDVLLDFASVLDERLKRRAAGNLLGSDSFQVFQFRLVLAGKSSHRPSGSPFKRR